MVTDEFNKDAITDVKQINLKKYDAYWGGEVAGTEYTGYLRGEVDTIYVPEVYKAELIRKLKLFKGGNDKFGVVKMLQAFLEYA